MEERFEKEGQDVKTIPDRGLNDNTRAQTQENPHRHAPAIRDEAAAAAGQGASRGHRVVRALQPVQPPQRPPHPGPRPGVPSTAFIHTHGCRRRRRRIRRLASRAGSRHGAAHPHHRFHPLRRTYRRVRCRVRRSGFLHRTQVQLTYQCYGGQCEGSGVGDGVGKRRAGAGGLRCRRRCCCGNRGVGIVRGDGSTGPEGCDGAVESDGTARVRNRCRCRRSRCWCWFRCRCRRVCCLVFDVGRVPAGHVRLRHVAPGRRVGVGQRSAHLGEEGRQVGAGERVHVG